VRVRSTAEELTRLTKKELVDSCREANLRVSGTKADLVQRLLQHTAEDYDPLVDHAATLLRRSAPAVQRGQSGGTLTSTNATVSFRNFDDDRNVRERRQPTDSVSFRNYDDQKKVLKRSDPPPRKRQNPADPQIAEAAIDTLVRDLLENELNADALIGKTEALLAQGGEIYARVKRRRLATRNDEASRGVFALLDGFVAAQQRLRSRDAVRLVLQAATEANIDEAFRRLREDGDLGAPLEEYVDSLVDDAKRRKAQGGIAARQDLFSSAPPLLPGDENKDDLLLRVLLVIKDRVRAEHQLARSDELRTLAHAIHLDTYDDRYAYLAEALGRTIDFAQRFEAYVEDARDFLDERPRNDALDTSRRVAEVADIVARLRQAMPL